MVTNEENNKRFRETCIPASMYQTGVLAEHLSLWS